MELSSLCREDEYSSLLKRSDLPLEPNLSQARVTLDQLVRLYQLLAVENGDEMMGLWERQFDLARCSIF